MFMIVHSEWHRQKTLRGNEEISTCSLACIHDRSASTMMAVNDKIDCCRSASSRVCIADYLEEGEASNEILPNKKSFTFSSDINILLTLQQSMRKQITRTLDASISHNKWPALMISRCMEACKSAYAASCTSI